MGLKIQGNDLQGAKIAISYRNTQGPCPKGFHIGSKDEWELLIDYLSRLGVYDVSAIPTVLNIPSAYYLARSNGALEKRYGIYRFWTSTMTSNSVAWCWGIDEKDKFVFQEDKPGNAFSIRPFKDEPVIPDSSWTEFPYGVFKNTTLGLISIQNASNWITISDKNLGATNVGDKGLYYQFGNDYGFSPNPSSYVTSKPTFSDEYGPQNPYLSAQFVRVNSGNNWFNGTCNNIWGGLNPTGSWTQVKDVQEIYIGSTKIRPTRTLVLQGTAGGVYTDGTKFMLINEQGGIQTEVMEVMAQFNTSGAGFHKGFAEEFWFLNKWLTQQGLTWQQFFDLYGISDWSQIQGVTSNSYGWRSNNYGVIDTSDGSHFYNNYWEINSSANPMLLAFADSNFATYELIAKPSSVIDASQVFTEWTPLYGENRVISFNFKTSSSFMTIMAAIIGGTNNFAFGNPTSNGWGTGLGLVSMGNAMITSLDGNNGVVVAYQQYFGNYKYSVELSYDNYMGAWKIPNYEILGIDWGGNTVTIGSGFADFTQNTYTSSFRSPFIWLPDGYSSSGNTVSGEVKIL